MGTTDEHRAIMDAVAALDEKVDTVAASLSAHAADGHDGKALNELVVAMREWTEESRTDRQSIHRQIDTMVGAHSELLEQHNLIVSVVLGEASRDVDGQIVRKGGIAQVLEEYKSAHGFRVTIPWSQLGPILVALIGGLFLIWQ